MVVYEVNLTIESGVVGEFRTWLKQHVQEMLTFDGFRGAKVLKVEEGPAYRMTVWYFIESRAQLEAYFQGEASRMRSEGLARFGGRFEANRRILELLDEPEPTP